MKAISTGASSGKMRFGPLWTCLEVSGGFTELQYVTTGHRVLQYSVSVLSADRFDCHFVKILQKCDETSLTATRIAVSLTLK